MEFDMKNVPDQKGKVAIVTGANIGLGYETALGLAQKNIKVIMACRNNEKAEKAKADILKEVPGADLEIGLLDLSKLSSVRSFASNFLEKYNRLDILINNAGIMIPPFSKTEDGFESQMGVNYFGHFLLTNLLFPVLEESENSRIVSLSSLAHRNATIEFDNLNSEKSYNKMQAYGQSKVACLMFAYELQRRLEKKGSNTISVAAHPGVSMTNLIQYAPGWMKIIGSLFTPFVTHPAEKGALPSLYGALGDNVRGGDYFGPTGYREMKGKPGKVGSSSYSKDPDVAKNLWETSEELTGQKFL
jgi:NAD(P)-dependent dehydrogenase (short-subunit alcohol dehydrogenase family)